MHARVIIIICIKENETELYKSFPLLSLVDLARENDRTRQRNAR